MTTKYHGTPITPKTILETLKGLKFCISYAAPQDVHRLLEDGWASGAMLDNGAFSAWRRGHVIDWQGYYAWTEKWLQYPDTWAVIGDVIDGDLEDNKRLLKEWPHGTRGAPVWHLHEPLEWLQELTLEWPRVCVGSSGQYARVGSKPWRERMDEAFDAIVRPDGTVPKLHMLRGLQCVKPSFPYPFDSVDSTDIARNHNRGVPAIKMAERWESMDCPTTWRV